LVQLHTLKQQHKMINVNIYDSQSIYSYSLEVDEYGAMPTNSTTKELPELSGEQVALWIGSDWQVLESRPEVVVPKYVPQEITMRQCRLALLAKDLLATVDTAIEDMNNAAIAIEWEYATTVQRNSDLVINLCTQLGMSSDEIDDLFVYADTL
jgi:hypothetical protein